MDEIFRHYGSVFVFRDKILTQQRRPLEFIEAEQRRILEIPGSPLESREAEV